MPRPLRNDFDGATHHVMNRGVDHQPVFFNDHDRVEFGRQLADIHVRYGIETLAYCLMPNHYHLLLHTPAGHLSAAMQRLGLVYTRRANDRVGRDGPLFRGRYHSIVVDTDAYLSMAVRYIHQNPTALPDVTDLSRFRWSSYQAYVGERPSPSFLRTDRVLGLSSGNRDALRQANHLAAHPRAITGQPLDARTVVQCVSLAVAHDDLLFSGGRTQRRTDRTLLLLTAELLLDQTAQRHVDDLIGFPSPEARQRAYQRARARYNEPFVQRSLTFIARQLGSDTECTNSECARAS